MAFHDRGIGDNDSRAGSGSLSREILSAVRWAAVPCAVVFVASWSVATLAGLHSAAARIQAESFLAAGLPAQAQLVRPATTPVVRSLGQPVAARLDQPLRTAPAQPQAAGKPAMQPPVDPFARIVAEAKLSRQKLVAAFASAGMTVTADEPDEAPQAVQVASIAPVAARFHREAESVQDLDAGALAHPLVGPTGLSVELAYAAVDESPADPVELALASLGDEFPDNIFEGDDGIAADGAMPELAALPTARPDRGPAASGRKPQDARSNKPASNERAEPQALAYARPDNPGGRAFGKLFKTPNAGDKVAVYDISAAVVHMPDGTRLEAHSGIGKMADNPRYVHVKMRGPTPPNTYKLSMREKLFHGVEAIRMTPIGEQTMHGRDGMLAHSYLLRGGREESHGCVAFANYPKFLKAFKQGKVTHLVVVPSLSKAKVQLASSSGRGG
ncbi:tlde1 domain-containing protein [Mesorhizobium marinum]|uniref:tlde1 domain-containing protein n=1 Tax=Mesorhizobium marinum TaxID=3228790 RepID=UPI0034651F84